MKNNTDVSALFKPFGKLLHRYHLTLFILFVLGCLTAAVLLLTNILNDASMGDNYQSSINAGSLDQGTLDRINVLHTSTGELPQVPQATGRTNPFAE